MRNNIGSEAIPTINTTQLESELLFRGGIPVSSLTAYAHEYFHINRVEDYFRMIDFPLPSDLQPRRMTVYNFIFITKGISSRSRGLDTYEFGKNTFFFVPAHQITTHKFIRQDVEGFYCHFNLELLIKNTSPQELFQEFPFLESNSHPLVCINENAKADIVRLLERLLKEYKTDKNAHFDILRTYLLALFTELKPFAENTKPSLTNAASNITEQFKKSLGINISKKIKINEYAEILNISPNHLNKCVKTITGKSAHDLLNEMLLLEAKVLLKQTNLNVTEIAYKIGKNEVSDFARFFKTQTGMRPSEYRMMQ